MATNQCPWPSGIHNYVSGVCLRCGRTPSPTPSPAPVSARTVDSEVVVEVLHVSLQIASELHPVHYVGEFARPYQSGDAPYARKGEGHSHDAAYTGPCQGECGV